jgi:AsmA protein
MSTSSKLILFAVGGFAGLVVLVAAIAAFVLSVNAKPRVEALASEALEMEVHIGGPVAIGFLPRLHIALAEVHLRKRGAEVASAGEVNLGMALLPLLHREVRIESIGMKRLRVAIERDRDGKLNIGRLSAAKGTLPALDIANASVSDATLVYADRQSRKELEASDCTLNVSRMRLKNLSLAAQLACGQMRTSDFTASDVKLSVAGKDGVFDFNPVTMRLFGGHGAGTVRADVSHSVPVYQVRYSLAQFRIEEFFKILSPKNVGAGSMDFSANLSLRGKSLDALKRTVAGEVSLHGENLRLEIGDLDKKFARYESSQSFNLVDVGAFFFAGPLGLGVTKGFNFARIFEGSEGSTAIPTLVSEWQVEKGVAHARDVAMATQQNRVALKGGLDFIDGQFDDVTVALIDAKGCPRVQQKIRGPFRQPEVEKPSVLAALAGPTRTFFKQAQSLLGGKCEVFYAGSVAPPTR